MLEGASDVSAPVDAGSLWAGVVVLVWSRVVGWLVAVGRYRARRAGLTYAGVFSETSPAAARSAPVLSVRSHVKSRSSRPKWPYAAVFA